MDVFSALTTELLAGGHDVRFSVHGPSMHPTIQEGDRVRLSRLGRIKRGDIVLCRLQRGLILHRLVGVVPGSSTCYRLRADGVGSEEETVAIDQIIGRAVSVERGDQEIHLSGNWAAVLLRLRQRLSRWVTSKRRPTGD